MVRSATIKNITVEGQITSTGNRVAGIAAYASGSNNVIEFCTNKATIKGNGEVGGIIGASGYSGTISKCRNLGTITGGESSTYVGGIIGSHTMASSLTIEYCYNTGTISADSSLADLNGGVAGITGHIMEGGSVKNCYNTASITRTYNNATYTTRAAGIVASQREKSSIINCYNTGKISAINTASSSNIVSAGITATAATSADVTVTIENCYYLDGSAEYGIYMQNTTQYKTIINDTVSTTDTSLYPEALDGIIENRNETLFKGAINSTTSVTYLLNNNGTTNIWTINNGYPILWWQTDAIFNETEKVNTPKIDETQGMKLVTFNTTTKTWEEDTTKSDYAYVAGTGTADNTSSRWANAVVTKNGVDSYFVWIPRYAYKIDSTNQKIDVKFIDGTGTTAFDGTVCKYADDSTLTSDDYIIHPAFTSNANLGGGFGQLSGLWIGKFESSRSDADATTAGTSTTLKVVPNVKSWTNTTIGEFYTYAKGYNANLNSHMLKNSEWGAVAYLAHSQYGRNGNEIAVSQCTDIITGAGPGTGDSNIYNSSYAYSASDFETTYSYTSEQGKKASTTGNEYGIYDITGGVYEYVASYYNVWESPSKYLAYASSFASSGGTSNKYATVYTGAEMSRNYIKGDATYETSGWNSDATDFYLERDPFFIRGGVYFLTDNAGIFRSTVTFGVANELYGFRACLAVE